ncbi:hypothetical protein WJX84_006072 [Apatococcus fuscideae]|uniref:Uncharacterized protein n=1 Tax=Apatococcus fuscideae TaxID=2026836 RepID=A0AAW1T4G4_9CHLO
MGNTIARCEEAQEQPEEQEVESDQKEEDSSEQSEAGGDDGGEEEEEEEEEPKPDVKVDTAPFDVRFPGTNQARHCYARYNEYHKCIKQKDEEDESCKFYAKAYRAICPGEWVEKGTSSGIWAPGLDGGECQLLASMSSTAQQRAGRSGQGTVNSRSRQATSQQHHLAKALGNWPGGWGMPDPGRPPVSVMAETT